jgi:hypothetical protein
MFFLDRREARKHSSPGKCVSCGTKLERKRRGALYCDEIKHVPPLFANKSSFTNHYTAIVPSRELLPRVNAVTDSLSC